MPAINSAIREIVGFVDRSRGNGGGQNKAVVGINSGMFFKAVMRFIFLCGPIGVQIPRELFGLTIFIKFTFESVIFFFQFFVFSLPTGLLVDLTSLAPTAMLSLMVSPFASNCRRISELI